MKASQSVTGTSKEKTAVDWPTLLKAGVRIYEERQMRHQNHAAVAEGGA
jgi:hypothetical protein